MLPFSYNFEDTLYLEQNGVNNLYNLTGGLEKWSDDVDPNMEKYR